MHCLRWHLGLLTLYLLSTWFGYMINDEAAHMENLALQVSEGFLSFLCEDVRHRAARHLLYERVSVQEWVLQGTRHDLPNRALSAACRRVTGD